MKYIKTYESVSDYDADSTKKYPHVGYLKDTKEVIYVKEKTDYSHDYLTFEALEDGTFQFSATSNGSSISYSTDGGNTWISIARTESTPTIHAGDTVMFKCNPYGSSSDGVGKFISTGRFNAMGNPYSMISGDSFSNITTLDRRYALKYLFTNCKKLISAENLALPATTVSLECYRSMFNGCTALTTPPELPATTLSGDCYGYMFMDCWSLFEAPELPATTLTSGCYKGMFNKCISLETAPELKATTLASQCYASMFLGCTSLATAPALPATTLADSCYNSMFDGCTALVSAPELPATTLSNNCYQQMFMHCQSLTTAPTILPATTLTQYCYCNMFAGCMALTTAPELPATTLADYCYTSMFNGCRNLNYIKMLATDISATNCLQAWVVNVVSSGTFVKDASMTTLPTGGSGIPTGWTVIDAPLAYSLVLSKCPDPSEGYWCITQGFCSDGDYYLVLMNGDTIATYDGQTVEYESWGETYHPQLIDPSAGTCVWQCTVIDPSITEIVCYDSDIHPIATLQTSCE